MLSEKKKKKHKSGKINILTVCWLLRVADKTCLLFVFTETNAMITVSVLSFIFYSSAKSTYTV